MINQLKHVEAQSRCEDVESVQQYSMFNRKHAVVTTQPFLTRQFASKAPPIGPMGGNIEFRFGMPQTEQSTVGVGFGDQKWIRNNPWNCLKQLHQESHHRRPEWHVAKTWQLRNFGLVKGKPLHFVLECLKHIDANWKAKFHYQGCQVMRGFFLFTYVRYLFELQYCSPGLSTTICCAQVTLVCSGLSCFPILTKLVVNLAPSVTIQWACLLSAKSTWIALPLITSRKTGKFNQLQPNLKKEIEHVESRWIKLWQLWKKAASPWS